MGKRYPEGRGDKSTAVRIPKAMAEAIEEFLKTDQAKRMGFLYKSDVVTAATRELLKEYGMYRTVEKEVTSE